MSPQCLQVNHNVCDKNITDANLKNNYEWRLVIIIEENKHMVEANITDDGDGDSIEISMQAIVNLNATRKMRVDN